MVLKITVNSDIDKLVKLFNEAKRKGLSEKKAFLSNFKKSVAKDPNVANRQKKAVRGTTTLKSSAVFNKSLAQLVRLNSESEGFNLRAVDSRRNPFLTSRDLGRLKSSGLDLLSRKGFTAEDLKDTEGFLNPRGSVDIRKAKKDAIAFLSNLNENGLRKLIGNDKRLLTDINNKLNTTLFIIEDSGLGAPNIVFLRNTKLSVNALKPRVSVNKTSGKVRLIINLDKRALDKLYNSEINFLLHQRSRQLEKEISKTSDDKIIALLFGLTQKPATFTFSKKEVPPIFTMNVTQDLPQDRRVLKTRQDKFISSAQYTAILQQQIAKKMPRGPERGPPLGGTILTYRSGRFVNSITAIINFKQGIIKYFFNPIYKAHRDTVFDPDENLIEPNIRLTTRALFGKQFRIIRGV